MYQRFKRWARQTRPFYGHQLYTWRHTFALRISKRYREEYDAELTAELERAFAGCDASKIQAGVIDASKIQTVRPK